MQNIVSKGIDYLILNSDIVLLAIIAFFIILFLFWRYKNRFLYSKRDYLATLAEQRFLKTLHKIISDDYDIHCQVSLIALLNAKNFRSARMIWAKRMDYVITDKLSRILLVIELDDASHMRKDRRKRDKFINKILKNKHTLLRFTIEESKNTILVKKKIDKALHLAIKNLK